MASVMVVEDERIAAEETAQILRAAGHTVPAIASSGELAVQMAERERPDLALVDIGLAGAMDGISVAERLQSSLGVGVLFVTSHSERHVVERAKQTAPCGYVVKPFNERMLEASVEVALVRHRADAALRDQAAWLSTLLAGIGVAIVATDEMGSVRFANDLASALVGREVRPGRHLNDCLHLVDGRTDTDLALGDAVFSSPAPISLAPSTMVLRADGRRIPVDGSVAPVRDASGKVQGMAVVLRDVRDRVEAERERTRAQRLEALSTLSAGMAHDFNNMLTIVGNCAELGMKTNQRETRAFELFHDIEQAASRASSLTRQLVSFTRGGAVSPRPTWLEPLARRITSLSLRGATTQATFTFDPDLWPVHVDETQLAQVFSNLVLNARQAMHDEGALHVAASNRVVGAGAGVLVPGRYVEVTLADRGPGIDDEIIDRIFDPYFTTKPSGSGLGLASAYGIATQHGGTLRVQSRSGRGATFVLTLPAADAPPRETRQSEPTGSPPAKILVMEDEENLRKALSMCLEELGHRVEAVPDGEDAVLSYRAALAAGRPFDAAILDLTILGGSGGVATLARLRALDPDVRAIVSSGYADSDVLEHPVKHGFAAALPKPYAFCALLDALRVVLGPARARARA